MRHEYLDTKLPFHLSSMGNTCQDRRRVITITSLRYSTTCDTPFSRTLERVRINRWLRHRKVKGIMRWMRRRRRRV